MPKFRPILFRYRYSENPFRGKHWYVSGFRGGKRIQQWCDSEKEARMRVKHFNAEVAAHGTKLALSPSARIHAVEAQERLAKYGKTIAEAIDFYCAYLDKLGASILVSELGLRVMDEFKRKVEAGEIRKEHLTNMQETLRKFLAEFGNRHLKQVSGLEIKAWLAGLPLAIKTRNRHLNYVRNIMGLARDWSLLDSDPLERIDRFNDPKAKSLQVQILTVEQLQALLTSIAPAYLPFVAINAFAGLRRIEIARLDWSEIKLGRNLIDLPPEKSKNYKRKLIEVPANLKAILAPFEKAEGPVVPKSIDKTLAAAVKKAGIPWPQNVLRHSFCSYAVALRGADWTAAQADHSLAMLRKHYWEVVDKEEAQKYCAIGL